jgi:hypothetical protein
MVREQQGKEAWEAVQKVCPFRGPVTEAKFLKMMDRVPRSGSRPSKRSQSLALVQLFGMALASATAEAAAPTEAASSAEAAKRESLGPATLEVLLPAGLSNGLTNGLATSQTVEHVDECENITQGTRRLRQDRSNPETEVAAKRSRGGRGISGGGRGGGGRSPQKAGKEGSKLKKDDTAQVTMMNNIVSGKL